jgi:hypothetical protein
LGIDYGYEGRAWEQKISSDDKSGDIFYLPRQWKLPFISGIINMNLKLVISSEYK